MKKAKVILKPILFIFIFFILLCLTSLILVPKNNDKASGIHNPTSYGFLGEKDNTIDILTIGDSESYSAISPMELYQNYGFTSYVCGTPRQRLYQSYDYLEKVIENQKLKVIFLETNAIFRKVNIWDYLQFESQKKLPVFQYHNRWKTISQNDLTGDKNYTWTHVGKGYRYNSKIKSASYRKYMKKKNEVRDISQFNYYFLNKIKNLCQENHIRFILISTPSIKNWNYTKHNGVQEYADKNGIEYIDMNLLFKEIPIDWKNDTRDKGDHLNYSGALKVTKYLGDYLKQSMLVEDHRNDKNFIHWDQDLKTYKEMIKNNVKF